MLETLETLTPKNQPNILNFDDDDHHHHLDVDECAEKLDSCLPSMEMCINDLGRYHCEPLLSADSHQHQQQQQQVGDNGSNELDSLQVSASLCPAGYTYDYDEQVCIG